MSKRSWVGILFIFLCVCVLIIINAAVDQRPEQKDTAITFDRESHLEISLDDRTTGDPEKPAPAENEEPRNVAGLPSSGSFLWSHIPLTRSDTSDSEADLFEPPTFSSSAKIDLREGDDGDEKARGDHPDDAVRFRNLQMQDENGKIPLDGLQKAREHIDLMRATQAKQLTDEGKPDDAKIAGINPGAWTWLGPGNIGGRIRSIVIDPVNTNNVWVGSVSGGIWKTTDAGASWQPVTGFYANLAVSTMVIDPANSSVMYAGTGEQFAADTSATEGERITPEGLRGDGIFKTTDGGVTWNQLPLTRASDPAVCGGGGITCPWSYVNRLAISPDGTTILAATINGIWRSTDGGASWNSSGTSVPGGRNPFLDADFDPLDSQKATASSYGGSMYTLDSGQTWSAAGYSPAIDTSLGPRPRTGRVELAYAPSNPQIIYASVDQFRLPQPSPPAPPNTFAVQGDVFISNDGGQNFTRINASNPGNTFLGDQGGYGNIIWVNPQDPTFVVVGGINMYVSRDSGLNWTAIANGAFGLTPHSDNHMVVADPGFDNVTNKIVYSSNDGGIFKTNDISTVCIPPNPANGTCPNSGWTKLNNNLGVTQFYGAAGNSAGVIVGGTQDNGTLRYSGDPEAWTEMSGGDGGYAAADPMDNNYFYGEYFGLGLLRSTDGGATSSYIYCNPVPSTGNGGPCVSPSVGITDSFNGANFIAPFILDPNEPNRMLAGGLSLWRSDDIKAAGLPAWTAIKPPATDRLIPPSIIPISAIAVSPNNPDLIVVGHNNGQIYLTFDGTGTNPPISPAWSQIDIAGITPGRFVTKIAIDETRSPNWIYATYGGFAGDNVYVTKDLGGTWTDVSGAGATSLPGVPVRSLVINPLHADWLYVGTEVGIFASEDAGATWKIPQDGPANVSVDELFWLKGDLVAVTHGRGLYKTTSSVYNTPVCIRTTPCACAGYWDCPCHWNSNRVPDGNDDVAVACPTTVRYSGAGARNIRVNAALQLNNDLLVAEDLANFGSINSTAGGGFIVACRNLYNFRPANAATSAGIITIPHAITVTGTLTNGGLMGLATGLQANNIITGPSSTMSSTASVNVSGNVDNSGSINATALSLLGISGVHNLSGQGQWKFGNFSILNGHTVTLGSDLTFEINTFGNNGTLDIGNRTLNFIGGTFGGGGTFAGNGTVRMAPNSGSAIFASASQNFTPAVTIASGTIDDQSQGSIGGPLTIDSGATFSLDYSNLTAQNDVTVNGALTKTTGAGNTQFNFNGTTFANNGSVGAIDFFTFNNSGAPRTQNLTGTGLWAVKNMDVGGGASSPSTLTLLNDVSFPMNQLQILSGDLNIGNNTLVFTGTTFIKNAAVTGTGTIKMQPGSGTSSIRVFSGGSSTAFTPELRIASGTVTANTTSASLLLNGTLNVNNAATFSLNGFGIGVSGDVINNGTINATGGTPSLGFQGNRFTNNGTISGAYIGFGPSFGPPITQKLEGTGSWAGTPQFYIGGLSTTTLLSDLTYNGGNFYLDGRLNTAGFTFSLPCTTPWFGAGDVVGNIRRTNLAACPGAILTFGNPFTTIQFTSGTPPTDLTFNIALSAPGGFANAIQRTYFITPTGGNNYTATLRLHYLDSELNGNSETTLQLWRNNGTNWTPEGVTNRNTTDNWVEYNNVTQFSPWVISGPNAPTAAGVSVAGRVLTLNGIGLRNVTVKLADQHGVSRSAITSAFGYYRFDDVQVGETYIISASSKQYRFTPQIISVADEITELNLVPEVEP